MKLEQANVIELIATAVRTATITPANGTDVSAYDGPAQVILQSSAKTAGTAPTLNVKLQHSDAISSGFADISGATFSEVTTADLTAMIPLKMGELKKYIRAVGTIGGTSTPTFGFGVSFVGFLQAGRNASQEV